MLPSVYKHVENIVHITNNLTRVNDRPPIVRRFRSKGLPTNTNMTKLLTSDQAITARRYHHMHSSTGGQCNYRVQVHDTNERIKKLNIISQTNILCDNHCNIELIVANENNKFKGMDAVVFHIAKSQIPKPLPAPANPKQTWIYFSMESPISNARERGFPINRLSVHATWTYHRGSDISVPLGIYRTGMPMTNRTKSPEEWVAGKNKLVAWMASNCHGTSWPRTAFVQALNKVIHVDMYGGCGNLKCPRTKKCDDDLLRQYKFYLSLENAECGDYITEKLWIKALQRGVVPIVNGPTRKVYEEFAPPNSFIYVGDYKNLQELANYLRLLDSKPELYAQFFEWRYKGSVRYGNAHDPPVWCDQVIPIIEKVKRGELKRVLVGNSQFARSCRPPPNKGRSVSAYGVKWVPW
ncbi:4-galactosyl-N-acetylglucosaminide 3-alpha-L-fucosyltransferase FUT6-like [Asterias amurensis]|uniref:4-galactosyl-N-acetylglucosaminide 3-alpha-L-fucosyltransferase FUT6-like n=1 Tax=Asterias amurensis TaxID=7602 RepID=UPI003AB6FFB4